MLPLILFTTTLYTLVALMPHALYGMLCASFCKRLHTNETGLPLY